MKESISQKEKLLLMMTEIYNQLEELESILEESFSEVRSDWENEELDKFTVPVQKITELEVKMKDDSLKKMEEQKEVSFPTQKPSALKLELGMN
jgi:hypothetical protein